MVNLKVHVSLISIFRIKFHIVEFFFFLILALAYTIYTLFLFFIIM